MLGALAIFVRLHDHRYHGRPEFPPAPARLFQALVAGAASGGLSPTDRAALLWLEALDPPRIAAPRVRPGQRLTNYVPNNDLDAVGRDPRRTSEIRIAKSIRPVLLDGETPFIYAWTFAGTEDDLRKAQTVSAISERLYQFGRGVDMAWASGEVLDEAGIEARLFDYSGVVWRPADVGEGTELPSPEPGSLLSLERRHAASLGRFDREGMGQGSGTRFTQPPKARFSVIPYNCPPSRRVFELSGDSGGTGISTWPMAGVSQLVTLIRDGAAARLRKATPRRVAEVDLAIVGRKADGGPYEGPSSVRVRIVPLPSIGHPHADRLIRRVMVEVPSGCSLPAADVQWAFSGLPVLDPETGEDYGLVLTPAEDENMLRHFGVGSGGSLVWRTVTPAALPHHAARRRIDPARVHEDAKAGAERLLENAKATEGVANALRHAGIQSQPNDVQVQREPFEARGKRVEEFASGTRFAKERLWHVEVAFKAPVNGPLVIGDGRFLGLGVMAPVRSRLGAMSFAIAGGVSESPDSSAIAQAFRRAVMSRVQGTLGIREELPTFFTGHESDGSPSRPGSHDHLAFMADLPRNRLIVVPPHDLERREARPDEREHLVTLQQALRGFSDLRAGTSGRLRLLPAVLDTITDPLLRQSQAWESVTDYCPARHAKRVTPAEAFAGDIQAELRRISLPISEIEVIEIRQGPRGGLRGRARLRFRVAVKGPILIGRTLHHGGGVFSSVD